VTASKFASNKIFFILLSHT